MSPDGVAMLRIPQEEIRLPDYYAIDTPVMLDEELPARAKLLYGLIAVAEEYSVADNMPDGILDCSEIVISRLLALLVKKGYIVQKGGGIYRVTQKGGCNID
jgi:hypothetical protein